MQSSLRENRFLMEQKEDLETREGITWGGKTTLNLKRGRLKRKIMLHKFELLSFASVKSIFNFPM